MNKKDIILEVALNIFNEKSYTEVGVREIARHLDISPGNLSYHFPQKKDILLVLLLNFGQKVSSLISENSSKKASIENFLVLFKEIFQIQYKFRGILIDNPSFRKELKNSNKVDYSQIEQRRREQFRNLFLNLRAENQIQTTELDIEFLVSFMSLFMRFAIHEAFLLKTEKNEEEIITYYLNMLVKQISLFSTTEGNKSIDKFRDVLTKK